MMIGRFRLERCPFDGKDIELQHIVSLHRQIEQGVGRRQREREIIGEDPRAGGAVFFHSDHQIHRSPINRERERNVSNIDTADESEVFAFDLFSIISTDDHRQSEREKEKEILSPFHRSLS